jgi:hypothetical protein
LIIVAGHILGGLVLSASGGSEPGIGSCPCRARGSFSGTGVRSFPRCSTSSSS